VFKIGNFFEDVGKAIGKALKETAEAGSKVAKDTANLFNPDIKKNTVFKVDKSVFSKMLLATQPTLKLTTPALTGADIKTSGLAVPMEIDTGTTRPEGHKEGYDPWGDFVLGLDKLGKEWWRFWNKSDKYGGKSGAQKVSETVSTFVGNTAEFFKESLGGFGQFLGGFPNMLGSLLPSINSNKIIIVVIAIIVIIVIVIILKAVIKANPYTQGYNRVKDYAHQNNQLIN